MKLQKDSEGKRGKEGNIIYMYKICFKMIKEKKRRKKGEV